MAEGVPLFQVDGLGDLAPLAAAAPPGAPDLPEGDIIALGNSQFCVNSFLILSHKFLFRSPLERGLFVCPGLHWGLLRWVAPWRAALAAKLASLLRCPAACADPRAALDAS